MDPSAEEIFITLYKNFDPAVEAGSFYVDCTDVRGGTAFTDSLCNELSLAQGEANQRGGYTHALFTGHIGGGKSSELIHLQDEMRKETPKQGRKRLFPVFIDMQKFLDDYDAAREEILLAIITEFALIFKRDANISLKDGYFVRRLSECKEYFGSDAEINKGEVSFFGQKLVVERLKTDPDARQKVREALQGHTSNFLNAMNEVFIEARTELRKKVQGQKGYGYSDFVLIVDGLDRLHDYNGKNNPDESQRALFLDDSQILTNLQAHCVFTIGLAAMRAAESELTWRYGRKPFLLPMIKTEKRSVVHDGKIVHPKYSKGRERLLEIIRKRLPEGIDVSTVFESEALEYLITSCGGHVRSLMLYARQSTVKGDRVLPITLQSVRAAVSENMSYSSPLRGQDDWERLVTLELSETQEWYTHDVDNRRLLEQTFVVEYINGEDKENGNHTNENEGFMKEDFNESIPWYAVHPIVRRLRPFTRLLEARQAKMLEEQQAKN